MQGAFAGCSNMEHRYLDFPQTVTVTDFSFMFFNNKLFNRTVRFRTDRGTNMESMFEGCSIFNTMLHSDSPADDLNFYTSSATNMKRMFYGCNVYKQPLYFRTYNALTMEDMFSPTHDINVGNNTNNYDGTLRSWGNPDYLEPTKPNVKLGMGVSKYSVRSEYQRNYLVNNKGWVITDGGLI